VHAHAGAAGLKMVEIPEMSESKATADSPVSAHTKVNHTSAVNLLQCCVPMSRIGIENILAKPAV